MRLAHRLVTPHKSRTIVLIYNFNFVFVFLALYLRFAKRATIVHQVEDVSVPRMRDWGLNSGTRPIQQILYFCCMHLVARLSSAYLVPTRSFLAFLPTKRLVAVLPGCIDLPSDEQMGCNGSHESFTVLFSGRVIEEHGILIFVDAIKRLSRIKLKRSINFEICGFGDRAGWLVSQLEQMAYVDVRFHGFVSDDEYRDILARADICVSLQNPNGRHSAFSTPSKLFEYLGHGKAVISTEIGAAGCLPVGTIVFCERFDGECLSERILELCSDSDRLSTLRHNARVYARQEMSFDRVGKTLRELFDNLTSK